MSTIEDHPTVVSFMVALNYEDLPDRIRESLTEQDFLSLQNEAVQEAHVEAVHLSEWKNLIRGTNDLLLWSTGRVNLSLKEVHRNIAQVDYARQILAPEYAYEEEGS